LWRNSKYLSDPTEDVRVATETLLADFVREIRDVSVVTKRQEEKAKSKRDSSSIRHSDLGGEDRLPDFSVDHSERAAFIAENDDHSAYGDESALKDDAPTDVDYRDTGGACPYLHISDRPHILG
jgi:vacuole morphology and inheritance protein 14